MSFFGEAPFEFFSATPTVEKPRWRLTGITQVRVTFFGKIVRTVQEERICGSFDGCTLYERRFRDMRASDLKAEERDNEVLRSIGRDLFGPRLSETEHLPMRPKDDFDPALARAMAEAHPDELRRAS